MARRPTVRMPNVVTKLEATGRKLRRPVHTFNLEWRPFELQPMMIAPVIPGETMKSLLLQARVVTDPVANPLIGWWQGFYFFYVKLRDLDGRDDFTEMFVDEDKDLSSYNSAASVVYNHYGGTVNWTALCLKRIVEEYFRDEGEAWDTWTSSGLPLAGVQRPSWLDSALDSAGYVTPDFDVDTDTSSSVEASEIEAAMRRWQMLKMNQMTDMSYEDYLMTYGIRVPEEEQHIPELIRYVENWTYPTNTIDPSSGAPSSALSWSVAERADKDRFFKEPGFIIGVTCTRPKVYLQRLDGSLSHALTDAYTWLPAVLSDDMWTSLRRFADGPPLTVSNDTDGYWIDVKDLFIYGDQFLNYDKSTAAKNILDLPDANLVNKKYPATTDIDNLFVDTGAGVGKISADGVVNLSILGRLMDTTPGMANS